jgi:hypothetical protein
MKTMITIQLMKTMMRMKINTLFSKNIKKGTL